MANSIKFSRGQAAGLGEVSGIRSVYTDIYLELPGLADPEPVGIARPVKVLKACQELLLCQGSFPGRTEPGRVNEQGIDRCQDPTLRDVIAKERDPKVPGAQLEKEFRVLS